MNSNKRRLAQRERNCATARAPEEGDAAERPLRSEEDETCAGRRIHGWVLLRSCVRDGRARSSVGRREEGGRVQAGEEGEREVRTYAESQLFTIGDRIAAGEPCQSCGAAWGVIESDLLRHRKGCRYVIESDRWAREDEQSE